MARIWFVTGASRGLGLEVARAALEAGDSVYATARDARAVTETLGPDGDTLHAASLDISDQHGASRTAAHAVERFGKIDVLVNNAAQAQLGWFETIEDVEIRKNFDVNVFGAMNVARAVLPHMRARRAGLFVTVSSVNGLVANPGGSIYSATKFALEGWMEGLAQELAPLGIRSLVIEPGMMRTDFLDGSSMRQGAIEIADYADATEQFRTFIAEANHKQPGDPAKLARQIIVMAGADTPPARYVFGDDALGWAAEKVDRLQAEIRASRDVKRD